MPHFKVWHYAPGLSDADRERLAAALEKVATEVLGTSPDAVSVDEVPVDPAAWRAEVYDVEIGPRSAALVRRPGYSVE